MPRLPVYLDATFAYFIGSNSFDGAPFGLTFFAGYWKDKRNLAQGGSDFENLKIQ
jgi:hypothetical protein